MDISSLMKESVFHAENEEPVDCRIQGANGRAGANRADYCAYGLPICLLNFQLSAHLIVNTERV